MRIITTPAHAAAAKNTTSFRAGTPLQMSVKVHEQCTDMPPETFKYVVEHKAVRDGLSFLSRHTADDPTSTPSALLLVSAENASAPLPTTLSEPKDWTQPVACDNIARFVGRRASAAAARRAKPTPARAVLRL